MTGDHCPVPKNSDVFILGEQIGTGAFANLYKAVLKKTNGEIAIKSYRMKESDRSHFQRAASEMAFLRFLKHPNIINYILSDIKRQYMYLGIEYSRYGSLKNFIDREIGFSELTVRSVMRQLVSALDYLHSMCILHGDVKPENIIVTDIKDTLLIKLIDFGLADVIMKDNKKSLKKVGSLFYMAPELLLGFPADYTADLFSAGVVMYEMIYNKKPLPTQVTKDHYLAILKKRMEIQFPEFDSAFFSMKCINLVKNLLSYDKQKRLSGDSLLTHSFINLQPKRDKQEHYLQACELFINGVAAVNSKNYGAGYIDIIEAILHLRIYGNVITCDDPLRAYAINKYVNYFKYAIQVEERLISDRAQEPPHVETSNERLRCLVQSTPGLLCGYDMCIIGEMYYLQGKNLQGASLIKDGLDVIFPILVNEPDGPRKNMLTGKITQWVNIVEEYVRLNGRKERH